MKPAIFGNGRRALTPFKSWLDNFWGTDNFLDDDMLVFRNRWTPPAVNIKDHKSGFDIEIAAPGMDKKDFDITVENGVLFISAEKESDVEEKEENYTRREFNYNAFERSFTLPENIDADKIDASYNDGILTLKLKKIGALKSLAKKIAIK